MAEKIGKITVLLVIVVIPALIAAGFVAAAVLPLVGQIEDLSVTEAKIAAGAVTSEKIADASIGLGKLAGEVKSAIEEAKEILDNSITTEKIADRSITTEKIESNSITGTKIADATITNLDIAGDAEIADSKLAESYLQIAFGLEREDKIYAGSINFGNNYPSGGKKVNLSNIFQNNIKVVIVEPSKSGYLFEVDSNGFAGRTFKVKAFYFDPAAAAAGPAVEVPKGTDLSTISSLGFIAIGG